MFCFLFSLLLIEQKAKTINSWVKSSSHWDPINEEGKLCGMSKTEKQRQHNSEETNFSFVFFSFAVIVLFSHAVDDVKFRNFLLIIKQLRTSMNEWDEQPPVGSYTENILPTSPICCIEWSWEEQRKKLSKWKKLHNENELTSRRGNTVATSTSEHEKPEHVKYHNKQGRWRWWIEWEEEGDKPEASVQLT